MAAPIYLHVGMPKTGTTSIQQYLHDSRSLLRRYGYVVPLCPGRTNHRNLTQYALPDDSRANIRRAKGLTSVEAVKRFRESFAAKFAAEARGWGADENILLTGEHLILLTGEEEFDRLKELLAAAGNRDVQVLIYLRRQDEFYVSLYSQAIKNGGTADWVALGEKINPDAIGNEVPATLFEYDKVVANWSAAFGSANVRVRAFERRQLVREDVVPDFLAAVHCDALSALAPSVRTNRSLDVRSIEYLRRLNKLFPRDAVGWDSGGRAAIISALERISNGVGLRMKPSAACKLLDRYREGNAWIAKRYLGRPDGNLFQEEPGSGAERSPRLSVDESIELGARLWTLANDTSERARRQGDPASPL